jgi:hypothetical protein
MRMAAAEFGDKMLHDILDRKAFLPLCDLRMEHNLKQHITKLLEHVPVTAAAYGMRKLRRLLAKILK